MTMLVSPSSAVRPEPSTRDDPPAGGTTRAEKVAYAQALRAECLTPREIAERMGVAYSTAHGYLSDPDGAKLRARKDSYRGTCVDCGRRTDGSYGAAQAPERCAHCARATMASRRASFARNVGRVAWTKEAILAALRSVADGRAPTGAEMDAAPGVPSEPTVSRRFGSWNNALRAAGLEPNRPDHQYAYERLRWKPDECVEALAECGSEVGPWPTHEQYIEWRQAHPETSRLPSSRTIRDVCGSWLEALDLAAGRGTRAGVARPRPPGRRRRVVA